MVNRRIKLARDYQEASQQSEKKRNKFKFIRQQFKPSIDEVRDNLKVTEKATYKERAHEFFIVWNKSGKLQDVMNHYCSTRRQIQMRMHYFRKKYGFEFKGLK